MLVHNTKYNLIKCTLSLYFQVFVFYYILFCWHYFQNGLVWLNREKKTTQRFAREQIVVSHPFWHTMLSSRHKIWIGTYSTLMPDIWSGMFSGMFWQLSVHCHFRWQTQRAQDVLDPLRSSICILIVHKLFCATLDALTRAALWRWWLSFFIFIVWMLGLTGR